MMTSIDPRPALAALIAALLAASSLALADEVQDASKLLAAVLQYPREGFVVVSFDQDYRSSNLSNTMRKRQYWMKEDGRWRILYEGGA